MTLIIEINDPIQPKPGRFKSPVVTRFWWLWFSVGILHIPLREFGEGHYPWVED